MKIFRVTLVPVFMLSLISCATIVSKSTYPVSVQSNPSGLSFTVTNKAGTVVHQGTTPSTVSLASGAGFFKAQSYRINVMKGSKVVGTTSLTAEMDGWYLGNILFGGLIGLLIVDPASGAMYALPKQTTVNVASSIALKVTEPSGFQIALIESLSQEERDTLIPLSK